MFLRLLVSEAAPVKESSERTLRGRVCLSVVFRQLQICTDPYCLFFLSQLEDAKKVLVLVSFIILNFSGIRHFDPKFLPLVQIYHSLQKAAVD